MQEDIQKAAADVIRRVHAYMEAHPESELHRQGKMFGVLLYDDGPSSLFDPPYLAAFSAQLDGSYHHEGFVPPVYEMTTPPVGTNREESRRLQQLLFANYAFTNGKGETKNLLDIFAQEKPILSAEEWFGRGEREKVKGERIPPAGAGECCAPKLLQYALMQGLKPIALAEFWVGAPSRTEIRQEGVFYAPCSGRCLPILRHMLQGTEVMIYPQYAAAKALCEQIEVIYDDDYLMVVHKPAGLLSVPGKGDEPSVESFFSNQQSVISGQPVFVRAAHRLDQDTSGLLVLAKQPEIYKTLQAYFQRRDVLKRYVAIVQGEGLTSRDEGIIDLPLLPNPYDRPRQTVDRVHGKPALTRYVIRERRADGSALVDLYPLTGRTHQLRVHAAHPDGLNAPIQGDRLYGGLPAPRLMLHAAEISFIHPVYLSDLSFCDSSSSSSWR